MPHSPGIGAIFGIVSEGGVAKASGRVGLYDRSTMQLVAKTLADAYGGYVFNGLNQTSNDYLVMALDDDGSPPKNALVQDYVQPIPAHMGATFPGNWWRLAMQKDPLGIFAGAVDASDIVTGAAGDNMAAVAITGSMLVGQASLTAGAPQLPSVTFNTGYAYVPGRLANYITRDPAKWTLEWVIDTSVSGGVYGRCMIPGLAYVGDTYATGPSMWWDRSTHKLWMGWPAPTGDQGNARFPFYVVSNGGMSTSSYTDTGIADGPHHFLMTIDAGIAAKLYLDGTLVKTVSLTGQATAIMPGYDCGVMSFANEGTTSGHNVSAQKQGPAALYPMVMSSTDVTAHYNALMVGSSPLVTGYVRDVLVDAPMTLVRLNAGTFGSEAEYLAGGTMTHYGSLTVAQSSPVTGGSMTSFGGGVMRGAANTARCLGQLKNTIEFWIKPTSAAPGSVGTIAAARTSDDSAVIWKVQQAVTTGNIVFYCRKSDSTYETITFNYAPGTSAEVLVAITLDKVAGEAKVYENGVLKDTQSMAVGYFYGPINAIGASNMSWNTLFVGGLRSTGASITEAFSGKLGEVAVYATKVGEDRLLSHYDSRTLT